MNPTDIQPEPPERDFCDELLAPGTSSEPAGLREQILWRTTSRIRWRRRRRRAAFVTAFAACWAGGMLTMRWLAPSPASVPAIVSKQSPPVVPTPSPTPSALALEWKAVDSDRNAEQAEFYQKAGDVYLKEEGDPLSAVRCYGHALDAAPAQTNTISTDDEWLLMAIKNARNKEKRNAKAVD